MSTAQEQAEQTVSSEVEKESIGKEQNGVASSHPSSDSEITSTIQQLLSAGKRNLACEEYPQAVEALAEACQLQAEKYGDDATELAESYFYYGRSLLELARMENGVLGNALDGVSAEEENEADLSESDQFEKASKLPEEEREAIVGDVYSAMAAEEKNDKTEADEQEGDKPVDAGTSEEKVDETPKEEELATEQKEGEEAVEEGESADAEEEAEGEGSADEATEEAVGSSQDEDDAEDVPNLQLAWEVLELSKKIYAKQTDVEGCEKSVKIRLSEVYRVLGEVSLETGAYEQAIQDITSCLELQTECMESDSRLIAETHYQLGNAHLLNNNYSTATEQLRKAKSVIETRISNLESNEKSEGKDKRDKELNELKGLLPDVIAKVEDVEEESRSAQKAEDEVKAILASRPTTTIGFGESTEATNGATTIATKKANDISNLVRKRKTEETDAEEVKKAKPDAASGDKENGNMEVTPVDS